MIKIGFHVDYDALGQMHSSLFSNVDSWNSSLVDLNDKVNTILTSDNMSGTGANSIRTYLDNTHNTILSILSTLISTHFNNCLLYINNYHSAIDADLHAVIDEEELESTLHSLFEQKERANIIANDAQNVIESVSDLLQVNCPLYDIVNDDYSTIDNAISELLQSIKELEDQHFSNDFTNTTELIDTLAAFIKERISDTRFYKTNYSVKSLAESASFLALYQAYIDVEAQAQSNEVAVAAAIDDENKRFEALRAEIEERQKQADRQKLAVAGLCIIGSMAAIALIVASGGTATPLVVGTVSAVSGAVMAGTNTAIDQYVQYGHVCNWGEIGGSALLGGVTGFMSGYIGAGVGGAITEGLSSSGSALLNSSSMMTRIGVNAAIGSTSQVTSGILSRGAVTFTTTMVYSGGDVFTSVEAANKSAFDMNQMALDATLGGVAGGIKGIKKPTSVSTIHSEDDIIDDGPYIKDGKPNGRPNLSGSEKLEFEQKVYENQIAKSKDGLLHDPNTGEIIDWKPGDPRSGVVDFGHKSGLEYADMFEKYKYGEISLDELKDFQFDPNNYQLEAPSVNRSHMFEAPGSTSLNNNSYNLDDYIQVTRFPREGIKNGGLQ